MSPLSAFVCENSHVLLSPESYHLAESAKIVTPALLIYPDLVEANIAATIRMTSGDPDRWRPHIKTAKIPAVLHMLLAQGVHNIKCSTTLELLTACQVGFKDALLAFPTMGANATRTLAIAEQFPATRISVLIESSRQLEPWRGSSIGIFLDVNPGMNRTGIHQESPLVALELAREAGAQFRGLHYYDGHMSGVDSGEREAAAHVGYRKLLNLVSALEAEGIVVHEVITSGTPAAPYAMTFAPFADSSFIHRISPGTVVYNDLVSLQQLAGFGYRPAACVLSTVVSHPLENTVTCDAGHKSVGVDAGVPNCSVLGLEYLQPQKPSEEHLPLQSANAEGLPRIGDKLYLFPKHVCPTVNNFDQALFVRNGRIQSLENVSARGHENPLVLV